MSNTLIVTFNFNPPNIKVCGPVKESTIEKLNQTLPSVTTSRRGTKAGETKFVFKPANPHYAVTLSGQFCDDVGESRVMLAILDAIEEEGTWKLSTTQAATLPDLESLQQNYYNTYNFFFKKLF